MVLDGSKVLKKGNWAGARVETEVRREAQEMPWRYTGRVLSLSFSPYRRGYYGNLSWGAGSDLIKRF